MSHARRLIALDEISSLQDLSLSALLEVLEDLHERKVVRLGIGQLEVFDVEKLRRIANFSKVKAVC